MTVILNIVNFMLIYLKFLLTLLERQRNKDGEVVRVGRRASQRASQEASKQAFSSAGSHPKCPQQPGPELAWSWEPGSQPRLPLRWQPPLWSPHCCLPDVHQQAAGVRGQTQDLSPASPGGVFNKRTKPIVSWGRWEVPWRLQWVWKRINLKHYVLWFQCVE